MLFLNIKLKVVILFKNIKILQLKYLKKILVLHKI